MAYSKAKLKTVVIKHLLLLDQFGYENYQTNFTYTDFNIRFVKTHFNQPNQFHGYLKLYENIVQHFPPNWIVGFLEVYE
jgi:hypothetical protein